MKLNVVKLVFCMMLLAIVDVHAARRSVHAANSSSDDEVPEFASHSHTHHHKHWHHAHRPCPRRRAPVQQALSAALQPSNPPARGLAKAFGLLAPLGSALFLRGLLPVSPAILASQQGIDSALFVPPMALLGSILVRNYAEKAAVTIEDGVSNIWHRLQHRGKPRAKLEEPPLSLAQKLALDAQLAATERNRAETAKLYGEAEHSQARTRKTNLAMLTAARAAATTDAQKKQVDAALNSFFSRLA